MCRHSLNDTPDRCSQCLQARGELPIEVQRVSVTAATVPPKTDKPLYGRRGGKAHRQRPLGEDVN